MEDVDRQLGWQPKLHPIFSNIADDTILRPEQISELLGVNVETVRRWCRQARLSAYSFGGQYIVVGSDFKDFMTRSRNKSPLLKGVIKNE